MSLAELFYVDGMIAVTLAFPTLLVGMWALDRMHARSLAARAAKDGAEPAALRHAA